MASIHKREKIWYVAWRDDKGKQHQKAVGPDKQAAKEEMSRKETETRRRKSGEIDQEDENRKDFAKMAISQHLDDWYTDMCNMGKDYYAHQNRIKIALILEAGNIARISELTHARVRAALIKLSSPSGRAENGTISAQTLQHYSKAIMQFSLWLQIEKRDATYRLKGFKMLEKGEAFIRQAARTR